MALLDNLKLAQLKQQQDEYKKQLADKASEIVKEVFDAFFAKAEGRIEAVAWRQYTPYFNDGDECVFSVREPTFKLAGVDTSGYGDYDDGYLTPWEMDYYSKPQQRYNGTTEDVIPGLKEAAEPVDTLVRELSKLLQGSKDVLRVAFDDHVKVTATPGKFEVDEYSHD